MQDLRLSLNEQVREKKEPYSKVSDQLGHQMVTSDSSLCAQAK